MVWSYFDQQKTDQIDGFHSRSDLQSIFRTRALTELESGLAGHLPELQLIKDASPQSVLDLTQSRELKDAWEEATKAITERYRKFSAFLTYVDQLV